MADRIHAEFAQHERPIFREILQAKQVALEVALVVQVNVEAEEIDVLRKEKFRRRITRVGKENVRIGLAPDANEVLDEFRHAPHAEPAHHRARDFVADEITEDRRMTGMFGDRRSRPTRTISSRAAFSRRNSTCFAQGSVIRTRIPAAAQQSRNQSGGT